MRIADSNMPASENISIIIKKKGLKQVFVAEKAGYTSQELNDMLNGRRLIKSFDILKIAEALGVTAGELYEAGRKEGVS